MAPVKMVQSFNLHLHFHLHFRLSVKVDQLNNGTYILLVKLANREVALPFVKLGE